MEQIINNSTIQICTSTTTSVHAINGYEYDATNVNKQHVNDGKLSAGMNPMMNPMANGYAFSQPVNAVNGMNNGRLMGASMAVPDPPQQPQNQ